MRKTKLLPAVAVRRVTRDVKLGDYFLPKGTKLNYVPATVHNDERVSRKFFFIFLINPISITQNRLSQILVLS